MKILGWLKPGRMRSLMLLSACLVGCKGPQVVQYAPGPRPNENLPTSLPEYVVNPPDVLFIDVDVAPTPFSPVSVGDTVVVNISNLAPEVKEWQFQGNVDVEADGNLDLGDKIGKIEAMGKTGEQIRMAIVNTLKKELKPTQTANMLVKVIVNNNRPLLGEYLVRPDGMIKLGYYGAIKAAGKSLSQLETDLKAHLKKNFGINEPKIAIDVSNYNSAVYYVISDGGAVGDQVIKLPVTGMETVLDAVSEIGGLPETASRKNIWIARPIPGDPNAAEILPVNWVAITKQGAMATNYQLQPNDRLYIKQDAVTAFDGTFNKLTAPVRSVLRTVLLWRTTVISFSNSNNNNGLGGLGGGLGN